MTTSKKGELPFSKHKQTGRSFYTLKEFKQMDASEAELQEQCENYLKEQQIPYIHIPAHAYKTQKVKAGVPDLIILKPYTYQSCNMEDDWELEINDALLIELKKKGGKASQGQKNFAKHANVYLVYSFPDFKDIVDKFMRI